MQISVIVVNWNSEAHLKKCLGHLNNQTLHPSSIIVIDNASNVEPQEEQLSKYENVKLIKNKQNSGFAAANNQAIRLTGKQDYVALLNPDAFPEPDWLEKLIAAADQYSDVAAFGSRQMMYGDHGMLDGIGDSYHVSGLAWRERHGKQQTEYDLQPKEIFSPCAAAALYRRKAIESVGGFDEDYFCYMEDVDLGFRLRLAGHKAMYVPDAVVYHIGSATTGGKQSNFSVYHGHRNLVWTYIKNMPGALFWLLLPYHLILNIFTIGWFMLRGQGGVILKAKSDAIKAIPRMWHKRRVIQSNRKISISAIWRVMDKRIFPWIDS
jgi:GT2 family glycosyltransferase